MGLEQRLYNYERQLGLNRRNREEKQHRPTFYVQETGEITLLSFQFWVITFTGQELERR